MNFMGTGTYVHIMYTVEDKAAKHAQRTEPRLKLWSLN